jgi:predicted transcriptional regulator
MSQPKLAKLELQIMEALWTRGNASIREIHEAFPEKDKPAQRKLIDDLLGLFGGRTQPVMAHLIESGKLTLDDVKEAEKLLRKLAKEEKSR